MLILFLLGRCADRENRTIARIKIGREPLDRATLTRGIPTFKDNQRAALMQDMQRLQFGKLILQLRQILIIIAVIFGAGFVCVQVDGQARSPYMGRP